MDLPTQAATAMAGRFLSIEETAQQLGVSVEEVNRLVDRKKLFPIRDGTTLKFKADEVDRVAGQLGEESSQFSDLSLDLDAPAAQGAGSSLAVPALSGLDAADIVLGDALDGDGIDPGSIFADDAEPADVPASPSQTIARADLPAAGSGAEANAVSGLSIPSMGSGTSGGDVLFGDSGIGGADSEELALESIVGASSPALASRVLPGDDATVAIDLGGRSAVGPSDIGGGSFAVGSALDLGAGSNATGAGAALSGVLDSGLSLEDGDVQLSGLGASGVDLGPLGDDAFGGGDMATVLGGDDFELGGSAGDDESASVVIAADESGDSSFFTETMTGEGSSFADDSAAASSALSEAIDYPHELTFDIRFSIWQLLGLVCCVLMLLLGGFVAFDLVRTIGSSQGTALANPLLDALASIFPWR